MKRGKIFLGVVLCFMVLLLTGCGNKEAITADDFSTIAEKYDCTVINVMNQYSSYGVVDNALVARNSDGWQVEFYVLDSENSAASMFNTNQSNFENSKSGTTTESSSNVGNYSTYTLTSGGTYMHLCRVDNTLLYVKVDDTYKDTVEKLIKELGY